MSLASRLVSLATRIASEIKAVRGVADSKVPLASVGVASGLATLDATGKLSSAQIPDAVLGALRYQGVWNANTNSPAIPAAAAANKGWYYIVSTAGATSVSGVTDWQIGDWLVSNGSAWNKIDNTDQVMSVAGLQGAISAASLKTALAIAAGDVSGLGTAATQPSTAFAASSHVGAGGAAHAAATTSANGFMSAADKLKLDGVSAGAQVNAVTSVAGQTGAVALSKADVGLGSVDNTADSAKSVYGFIVNDTRAVVSSPSNLPARSGLFEFKNVTSVGSPQYPATGTYTHVFSMNGWTSDGTGGWPTQISFGTSLEIRNGTSATTWGPWKTIYDSANLVAATASKTGLMSSTDKAKLDAVGTMANRNVTISTASPSGGADGDVWFKV